MSNTGVTFDSKGRLEPDEALKKPAHLKSRNYFKFPDLDFDPKGCYKRISSTFDISLSEEHFVSETTDILNQSRISLGVEDDLNVIAVPFFTPKLGSGDLGEILENTLIPAVGKSYTNIFPELSLIHI